MANRQVTASELQGDWKLYAIVPYSSSEPEVGDYCFHPGGELTLGPGSEVQYSARWQLLEGILRIDADFAPTPYDIVGRSFSWRYQVIKDHDGSLLLSEDSGQRFHYEGRAI
jgi:hypothetical protein